MFTTAKGRVIRALFLILVSLLVSTGLSVAQTCAGTTTWNLTAGQTITVGTVSVCNDATNLYITYNLTYPGATFGTLHVWAGSDLANMPATSGGTPIPGKFCKSGGGACYDATGLTTYTFIIPLAKLSIPDITKVCGATLYVVAHAEVNMGTTTETAFGGNTAGSGPRWWFYGAYKLDCTLGGPPSGSGTKTAFAKCASAYVFTTDPKSNPEGLPSLRLTKNRWGWAASLPGPGTYTCALWAGAGLNNTANGTNVGTVTINWNGATVTVTYSLASGYLLKELHLYAGDAKPITLAPGQYGYLDGFDPGVSTYTFTVPLTDSDGTPGVWIIAHAVVSSPTW